MKKKTYLQRIKAIVGGKKVQIQQIPKTEYSFPGLFKIYRDQVTVATFYLQKLPGCCGACILHDLHVSYGYRKKGLGKIINRMAQQLAWDNGYTVMLGTDVTNNEPQKRIFNKTGWEQVSSFKNRRTQNNVGVQVKKLKTTGYKIGALSPDGKPFKIAMY